MRKLILAGIAVLAVAVGGDVKADVFPDLDFTDPSKGSTTVVSRAPGGTGPSVTGDLFPRLSAVGDLQTIEGDTAIGDIMK